MEYGLFKQSSKRLISICRLQQNLLTFGQTNFTHRQSIGMIYALFNQVTLTLDKNLKSYSRLPHKIEEDL